MRRMRDRERRARIPGMLKRQPAFGLLPAQLVDAWALRGLLGPPSTRQVALLAPLVREPTGTVAAACIDAMPDIAPIGGTFALVGAMLTAARERLATMRKHLHNRSVLHNPVMGEPKGDEIDPSIRGPARPGPGGSPIPRTAADFFNPSTWARGWYQPKAGERVPEGPVADRGPLLRDVRGRPRRALP